VESDDKRNRYRLLAGRIALSVITLHVVICIFLFFLPTRYLSQNSPARLYKSLVLLGPFFTESRIKDSPRLSIRIKNVEGWSEARELTQEHFSEYAGLPWRYDHLARISYERYLGQAVGSMFKHQTFEKIKEGASFRELNAYLMREVIKEKVDSIEVVYGSNLYIPASRTFRLDTIFASTYNPLSIGKPKK
jgi:hypothetical protein